MTRSRGFTLIELMLVLAISAVMSTLAVVSLRETLNARRESGAARALAMLVKRARVIAVDTHSRVRVDADTAAGVVSLSGCKSTYGRSACAAGQALTALLGTTVRLDDDELHGVKLSAAPATPLVFTAAGFPEAAATYTWVVDHPERPGVHSVVVSAAGDVHVQ